MIPVFPVFKKIEISDREAIESFSLRYPPYSDFNFTNLWAWDTEGVRKISELNGNLVVLFTDYQTGEPFLSFLGTNEVQNTARSLLQFAKESNMPLALRLITEESATLLDHSDLLIEPDENNHDYVFSVSLLADPKGGELKEKRSLANRFVRENPDAHFELRPLRDSGVGEQILKALHRWEQKKKQDNKPYDIVNEEKALMRVLESVQNGELANDRLFLSGVFSGGNMLGFCIDEIVPDKYAISHFIKADNSYKGIYEFLNEKVAQYLSAHDVDFWNWQQDLNIEGLRTVKQSYHPVKLLKKCTISYGSSDTLKEISNNI